MSSPDRHIQMITVTVVDIAEHTFGWPPVKAAECVKWFEDKVSLIPREHRDTARIEISNDSTSTDSGAAATITITYQRPETEKP